MSDSGLLSPHQSELCVALQLCGDLEEEMRQRELAAARATLQLDRRESTLDGLLELNTQLVTALQQYRALLDGMVGLTCDRGPLFPLSPHRESSVPPTQPTSTGASCVSVYQSLQTDKERGEATSDREDTTSQLLSVYKLHISYLSKSTLAATNFCCFFGTSLHHSHHCHGR